tara:strand:+ start:90 stop:254 length:165 start_codon:yes stop_codon:yes gene_type:complete
VRQSYISVTQRGLWVGQNRHGWNGEDVVGVDKFLIFGQKGVDVLAERGIFSGRR